MPLRASVGFPDRFLKVLPPTEPMEAKSPASIPRSMKAHKVGGEINANRIGWFGVFVVFLMPGFLNYILRKRRVP